MNLNRRILALYLVALGTLAALASIHAQALGYGQVLEARNQTVMTTGITPKPAVSCGVQGCTNTAIGHPTHGGPKHGPGGGVIYQ
jgi:hypothetical protein